MQNASFVGHVYNLKNSLKFKLLAFWRKQTPFIAQKCTSKKVPKNLGSALLPLIWTKSKRSAVFPQDTFPQPKGCFGVLYFSNYIDCKSIKCFCSKCIILLQDRDVFHDRVISSVGELSPLRSQRTAPIDCFC